jgi:phosphate transport system substrate-binding protein
MMRRKTPLRAGALVIAGLLVTVAAFAQTVTVDKAIPNYKPTSDAVAGTIKSVGSDTMNNLMTLWAEGFMEIYPNVQVEIEGKGSSTAPPAIIKGQSTFGPMSRRMKDKEQDEFEKTFGYKCTQLRTSIDMLAVYVHKDNPIKGLTLPQVDAIFSKTRKLGYAKQIRTWGDLGLTGEWASKPISLYGRNSASGTYAFFKDHALGKGDYRDEVKEQPGSSAVIQGVATDKYGIGYSGIGYKTADVKVVSLAEDESAEMIPANAKYAYTGEYPLARFLFISVNYKPGSDLDPLRREFLKYIFSQEGQQVVVKDGYFPVPWAIAKEDLERVGIDGMGAMPPK